MNRWLSAVSLLRWRRVVILFELGLVITLLLPRIGTRWFANLGGLFLARVVLESTPTAEYPHWKVEGGTTALVLASQAFDAALHIDSNDSTAEWGRARVALALGRANEAAQSLPSDSPWVTRDPLRFMDAITAWSRVGDDSSVFRLYLERPTFPLPQVVSDTVALAHLHQAIERSMRGDDDGAQTALQRAIEFRPFDLCANFRLWRAAYQRGDREQAQLYLQRLRRFSAEAVAPTDERLVSCVLDTIPMLLSADLWGNKLARNVMSYWVWQYPELSELGDVLDDLAAQFPNDPYWPFYQGERYHRLGEVALAQHYYQRVLELDADFAPALDRLARLDLHNGVGSATLSAELDRDLAAHMLEVPTDTVQFGSNLLRADTLVSVAHGTPAGWLFSVAGMIGDFGQWPFATGRDPLEREGSLRIVNLLWPETDTEAGHTAYAEFWYGGPPIDEDMAWMIITVNFRLEANPTDTNRGLVYVTVPDNVMAFPLIFLPDTGGQWKRLTVVGQAPAGHSPLILYLRNYGAANVWFQNVSIRRVELSTKPKQCIDDPCILLSSVLD